MRNIFNAFLLISFGGPEKREDVIPFLKNVLRGRDVPESRLLDVAEHYYHFDGRSPINNQNRQLMSALQQTISLPIYWGNRNWDPMLADTIRQMRDDGVKSAIAFATSAFGSYSGCRQYQQDIDKARAQVESAPVIVKIPPFSGHPLFIKAMTDRVRDAAAQLPDACLLFTAHSIPVSMAESGPYVRQLQAACAQVAAGAGFADWKLVYQSRSGPPTQPWLEPDVFDYMREIRRDCILAPIGFLSDHMEVLYDLDTEARAGADELGIKMVRAGTVGTHPAMIQLIKELIEQEHVACATDCCPAPRRPTQVSSIDR